MASFIPPSQILDDEHRAILSRAVRNVLETDIAEATFAQIIDGLPTRKAYYDVYHAGGNIVPHPLRGHIEVCPGAEDRARQLRSEFDPGALQFSSSLLEAFQNAPYKSLRFNLRLIEIVAVSLHQIAVFLHQHKEHLHDPATTEGKDIEAPAPTNDFYHLNFANWKKYPNGVDDMAGYWAENRILGGVVLFKHSENRSEDDPERNAYFQSSRRAATFRVWQLLDKQQKSLVSFLTTPDISTVDCPLPILPDEENLVRCDPDEAIPLYHIYRDIWERTPPKPVVQRPIMKSRCYRPSPIKSPFDYPELEDEVEKTYEKLMRLVEQEEREKEQEKEQEGDNSKEGSSSGENVQEQVGTLPEIQEGPEDFQNRKEPEEESDSGENKGKGKITQSGETSPGPSYEMRGEEVEKEDDELGKEGEKPQKGGEKLGKEDEKLGKEDEKLGKELGKGDEELKSGDEKRARAKGHGLNCCCLM